MMKKMMNLNEKSLGPNIISFGSFSCVGYSLSLSLSLSHYINWVVKLSYKLTEIDIWKGSVM